jgi:hypothetical protein
VKYFLSGATGVRPDVLPEVAAHTPYRLLSMHSVFKQNTRIWSRVAHHPKSAVREVMLDSGAFTAFVKGKTLRVADLVATYDDALRQLPKTLDAIWLINLDVIPGEWGRIAEEKEVKEALDRSDDNFRILRKRYGDRVLPVYHQTEPMSRLMHVARQASFIGLGFRQDFAEAHRINCAEETVRYAHGKGILVHGLATTGTGMLTRVPFDTVDSATWLYVAAMGKILCLDEKGKLRAIPVSERSPAQRDWRGHYRTLPREEQRLVDGVLSETGTSITQVETDLSYRTIVCAQQMTKWMENYSRPTIVAEKGLFAL